MKIIFSFLLVITALAVHGQETVKRSHNLTNTLVEKYSVLKSDKHKKQGEYNAFENKILLAHGNYQDNKRVGEWQFYNDKGKLVQTFDYATNKMLYLDTADTKGQEAFYGKGLANVKGVSRPVKIGGTQYSLATILYGQTNLSSTIGNDFSNAGKIKCTHVLTIDENGDLIKHEVLAQADGSEKLYNMDNSNFDIDFKKFVPAMVNNHSITSQVFMPVTISFIGLK